MDDRKLEVLRAIVSDYVSSREPVGSKALVERHGLDVSPATVRNDMAALEAEGYIVQPHTSAGRIPTDKGYRLFVDRLSSVKPLSSAERRAISTFMAGALDLDDVMSRTVRLLAQITQQVAIVQYPVSGGAVVRHVELVGLTADRALVVVILSTGRVDQRTLELSLTGADVVARLRSLINAAVTDLTIEQARGALSPLAATLPPDAPADLVAATRTVVSTVLDMLVVDRSDRVVVGGVPNLARFADEFDTAVRPVLEALEENVVLLRLLGEAVNEIEGEVTVRIGHENPYEQLQATSLVASSYGTVTDGRASLGVVGPTRMDYPSTMASVRAVARYVGRFLAEG